MNNPALINVVNFFYQRDNLTQRLGFLCAFLDYEKTTMIQLNTEQMRDMIGLRVKYHEVYCQVIEIIEDGPSLILEDLEMHISIQADQHGEAHRKVPKTYTVTILSQDMSEFSPAFLALEPLDL